MRYADTRLGISTQATMLLELLAATPCPDEYVTSQSTAAWYNGREHGISVTYRKGFKRKPLIVVFTECRNSDDIVIYNWEADLFNPPIVSDLTPEVYSASRHFPYLAFQDAVDHIMSLVREWHTKNTTQAESK